MTDHQLGLLKEERKASAAAFYVVLSLVVHSLLFALWLSRQPAMITAEQPRLRYVEMVSGQQSPVVEAVGAPQEMQPRPDAPLSNANRTAATPEANLQGRRNARAGMPSMTDPTPSPSTPVASAQPPAPAVPTAPPDDRLQYRVNKASAAVDWNAALRNLAADPNASASATPAKGGSDGDGGFAESAPLSFESQWFPWGDYADHMVRRIRQHWHANMPEILKAGMKGVVTIRFTIERSGRISDITVMEGSGVPPFDFAARKAIELSSPLRPLPADFPGSRERVTARFFYNMRLSDEKVPPGRS